MATAMPGRVPKPPPADPCRPVRRPRRPTRTLSRREMARELRRLRAAGTLEAAPERRRPRTRAECRGGPRPCLFVSCRYHLYLDVNPRSGSVRLNFPDREVWELEETCALDLAEQGAVTLDHIGELLGVTRERVRRIEQGALKRLEARAAPLVFGPTPVAGPGGGRP